MLKNTVKSGIIHLSKTLVIVIAVSTLFSSMAFSASNTASSNNPSSNVTPVRPILTSPMLPAPPPIQAKAYVLIDANSDDVIAQKNPDQHFPPASLTKMMTLYLLFQALHHGQIQKESLIPISVKAWRMGGSKMFVKEGTNVSADELIRGIIVDSGNDASVAVAEYLGGSEDAFVSLMNQQAKALGMTNTHFTDSHGMPDVDHYSSAHDMALLARALITHFPEYYDYFSQKSMTYSGIKQYNRNRLLWQTHLGADGLKTGHTEEAGFCLVSSAKQGDQRLIAVIMGTPSDNARTQNSAALLNYGFRFFETHKLYDANTPISRTRVWQGKNKQVTLGISQPVFVTIPRGQYSKLTASMTLEHTVKAPITQGQPLGELQLSLGKQQIASYPVLALQTIPRGNLWRRMLDSVGLHWHNWFGKSQHTAELNQQPINA